MTLGVPKPVDRRVPTGSVKTTVHGHALGVEYPNKEERHVRFAIPNLHDRVVTSSSTRRFAMTRKMSDVPFRIDAALEPVEA